MRVHVCMKMCLGSFAPVRKLSVKHQKVLPGGKLRLHNKTYEISGVTTGNLSVIALSKSIYSQRCRPYVTLIFHHSLNNIHFLLSSFAHYHTCDGSSLPHDPGGNLWLDRQLVNNPLAVPDPLILNITGHPPRARRPLYVGSWLAVFLDNGVSMVRAD